MGRLSWREIVRDGAAKTLFCSLIGPRHVITASHCGYRDAQNLPFPPIFDSNTAENSHTSRVQARVRIDNRNATGCAKDSGPAILILSYRISERLGRLGLAFFNSTSLFQKPVFNRFGFPGDSLSGLAPNIQSNISVT